MLPQTGRVLGRWILILFSSYLSLGGTFFFPLFKSVTTWFQNIYLKDSLTHSSIH